jgi:UDP-galactopyranose mutase
MKKILIVGAGLSGAVIARELAEKTNSVIDVIESRNHIGGNCHTYRDPLSGVMIHAYGPHIFNTDLTHVWEYVNRFSRFMPFTNRVKASTSRGVYSMPINLHTINQFYGRNFSPSEARDFIVLQGDGSISEPANFEEQALKFIGKELYEAFFKGYTQKQWGCDPKCLPASILKRLPVRFTYDDNYYSTQFQGIPEHGYSSMIENILAHPQIKVSLNTEYKKGDECSYDHLFYSGPIDRFYNYCNGRLRYRTVWFERIDADGDYQGNAVINYPEAKYPYTRVHEHKHFTPWESHVKTVAFREYSKETTSQDLPFYPLRLKEDLEMFESYRQLAQAHPAMTFIGRLGTYQYLDMDDVIDDAFKAAIFYINNNK